MHVRLADHGLVFSTRDRGERLRDGLLKRLGDPSKASLTFDFDGVITASYSFVDELVGDMAERMTPNAPHIAGASPKILRTIEKSLRNRGLDADRILASSLQYV
jgi:hypothetical protein